MNFRKEKPLIREPLRISEEERKAVQKAAKRYKISANHFKRACIIEKLQEEELLPY